MQTNKNPILKMLYYVVSSSSHDYMLAYCTGFFLFADTLIAFKGTMCYSFGLYIMTLIKI